MMNSQNSYFFLFYNGKILLKGNNGHSGIPTGNEIAPSLFNLENTLYLDEINEQKCFAADLDSEEIPQGYSLINLRELFSIVDYDSLRIAYRASHLLAWMRNNKFCGRCGSATGLTKEELALKCVKCGHITYPRISPAIIVAVTRGEQILLARSFRFPPGRYSVIAGFVEPGETLEECVKRELNEEVGIAVKNIKYFSSQPWPFPDSLMIAFTAEYAGGDIRIDNKEIADAGWFFADRLPDLPPIDSVARKLINDFAQKHPNIAI